MMNHNVLIEISARHVHLSANDFVKLFGKAAKLSEFKKISQPNQFAAKETVEIIGAKANLSLRIVGPLREETQVELTATDCKLLGISAKLRISGNLTGTPGCVLRGPNGELELNQGVIVAQRHFHISPKEASELGLHHGDVISISTSGTRPVTFHDVYVRSREGIDTMSFMIDTDEANAAGLVGGEIGIINYEKNN